MIENISPSIYVAGVLGLGIAAQWIAWRVRLPAIVLLLGFGFAVGQLVEPPDPFSRGEFLFPLVSLAVGVILFEGGLSLRFRDVRETRAVVLRLVTIGLAITWLLGTLAARWLLGFSWEISALAGALLTVSGPTVIVPLLNHVRPTGRIGSLIKWEGIVNDPIGAVLAALVFEVIAHGPEQRVAGDSLMGLATTLCVGIVLGGSGAWLIVFLLKRYLVPDFLQNPIFLTLVIVLFAISNQLQEESGLFTVTLMGVILANQQRVTVRHVIEFKENLRVLLIATLFIVLAARVPVTVELWNAVGWPGLAFAVLLILVVRPIAATVATLGSELSWRERALLCWIHPRGIVAAAVASLFALKLGEEAEQLVFVTFQVIVVTVTVYGLTLGPLARALGLARPEPQGILLAGASPLAREIALALKNEGVETLLVDSNAQKISAARMAGLRVCLASIGSEFVYEENDLAGIGRLLAMTPNDEVNTLATMEFVEHFGSAGVYQLAPREAASSRYERIPPHRRGRLLFAPKATFELLEKRFQAGQTVKKTLLTDDFSFDDFRQRYGDDALILFVVDDNGRLHIRTADDETTPDPGMKVVALVEDLDSEVSPRDARKVDAAARSATPQE